MSGTSPRAYRFATPEQWRAGLLDRLAPGQDGSLVPRTPFATQARLVVPRPASVVAAHRLHSPFWREAPGGGLGWLDEAGRPQGPLALGTDFDAATRLVLGPTWLWAVSPSRLDRFDAETFDRERTFGLADLVLADGAAPSALLDIAGEDGPGLWILVGETGGGQSVRRLDGRGCIERCWPVPPQLGPVLRLCVVDQGRGVLLLSGFGGQLSRLAGSDGTLAWSLDLGVIRRGWTACLLAADGRDRVVLAGPSGTSAGAWTVLLLDGDGDLLQPPLEDVLSASCPAPVPPGSRDAECHDIAVTREGIWFATDDGLLCLDAVPTGTGGAGLGSVSRGGVFVTPALCSPITPAGRGWLRAEIDVTLPRGAALAVGIASTDDPALKARVETLAAAADLPQARRQEAIWTLLSREPASPAYVVTSDDDTSRPVAIPLFTTPDRWLWLRLELQAPPSGEAPRLAGLRVLYPELSLMENLPAMFRRDPGEADDLRHIVGVLEATTQDIDRSIREGARELDPRLAGKDWLDLLAQWLAIPWHRALPTETKRRLLARAGELLPGRTRRAGLMVLLETLVGKGHARVADLTADFAPLRLGGRGRPATALPALLAGTLPGTPSLGGKAVLGRLRLSAAPAACDPLESIAPTLLITLEASRTTAKALAPLLPDLLLQAVPAGVRAFVRWHTQPAGLPDDGDAVVLEGNGPGRLGHSSGLGTTILAGRAPRLDDFGAGMDQRLR